MSTAVNSKIPELNTTLITGALVQLAHERNFFKWDNPARNRRIIYYLSFVIGAVVGAAATKYLSPSFGILITAIVKTLVTLSLFLNDGEGKEEPNTLKETTRLLIKK